jgi:hypothetical protein
VISSSPMDLQRVFAEIAKSAARLCDARDAVSVKVKRSSQYLCSEASITFIS